MRTLAALIGLTVFVMFEAQALAEIELDPQPAVVGKSTTVVVTVDGKAKRGLPVKVTYYPNSEVKRVEEIDRTDENGRSTWTPTYAGLAMLSAGDDLSRTVGVRYVGVPPGALIVFFIAGTLLFGGIALGISRLRGDADSDGVVGPST